ncbi:MAG: recombinase A [Acidobacteria bacterium]|nr:MAG: recombinase A [Acidobacteriota bacterium]
MSVSQAYSTGISPSEAPGDAWGLSQMMGRLVEISGHRAAANLTVAFGLVLEAQRREETAVWVTLKHSTFFPPDVAASGISLAHLAVVRVDDARAATRATVELTRSGGFDLVVLDLGPEAIREKLVRRDKPLHGSRGHHDSHVRKYLSTPLLTKLVGIARKNATAVVVLTEKTDRMSSVSSLISLRAEARRDKDAPHAVEVVVLKDKRRGPGRLYREVCHVPAGLR